MTRRQSQPELWHTLHLVLFVVWYCFTVLMFTSLFILLPIFGKKCITLFGFIALFLFYFFALCWCLLLWSFSHLYFGKKNVFFLVYFLTYVLARSASLFLFHCHLHADHKSGCTLPSCVENMIISIFISNKKVKVKTIVIRSYKI